jgi:hypothetical protein
MHFIRGKFRVYIGRATDSGPIPDDGDDREARPIGEGQLREIFEKTEFKWSRGYMRGPDGKLRRVEIGTRRYDEGKT